MRQQEIFRAPIITDGYNYKTGLNLIFSTLISVTRPMNNLTIFVNNQPVFEYDRETTLAEDKRTFLENMDSDMSRGIKIQGELISEPDTQQRAKFMVLNMIKAIQQDNQAVIQASCAYLVNRLPDLVEVQVNEEGSKINIELVEDN